MYLHKSAYLIAFFFILVSSVAYPAPENPPLEEIYKSGKIELIPELIITRDNLPDDLSMKFFTGFSLWKGNLYITDTKGCRINMLSETGQYIKTFGRKGKGPSDLYLPSRIMCRGDRLTVWEIGNRRFSVFDAKGNFINSFSPPLRGMVMALKSLDDGSIIVERDLHGVVKGEFQQYFGLELFTRDFKYIKDLYTSPISSIIYSKKYRRPFARPFPVEISWDVLPGNKIVIGDGGNYQLEIHDMKKGKIKTFSHPYTPEKVTAADKEAFFASIISDNSEGRMTKGADALTRKITEFPQYKPAFKRIHTDCEGNILVFNYGKMEKGYSQKLAIEFDAFDSSGDFINHVFIMSKDPIPIFSLYSANGGVFWTTKEDDDIDNSIVRYRVKYNDKKKVLKNAH
ncbi:MAG: hypothetical protein PVH61_43220 [Candidatus Aminicenantes bacterium]|jgi:hypothetical protein